MDKVVAGALEASLREAESVSRLLRARSQSRTEDEEFLIESYKTIKIENDMYRRKLAECEDIGVKLAEAEYEISCLRSRVQKQKEKRKFQDELCGTQDILIALVTHHQSKH